MAKKEVLYYCEICGERYGSIEKADNCEKEHYKPIEIGSFEYDKYADRKKEYPLKVRLKIKNGYGVEKVIEYTRK